MVNCCIYCDLDGRSPHSCPIVESHHILNPQRPKPVPYRIPRNTICDVPQSPSTAHESSYQPLELAQVTDTCHCSHVYRCKEVQRHHTQLGGPANLLIAACISQIALQLLCSELVRDAPRLASGRLLSPSSLWSRGRLHGDSGKDCWA